MAFIYLSNLIGSHISPSILSASFYGTDATFEITVSGSPGAGYLQDLAGGADSTVVQFLSMVAEVNDTTYISGDTTLIGVGGLMNYKFSFVTVDIGITFIVLQYKRDWEPDPAEIKIYPIQVKNLT